MLGMVHIGKGVGYPGGDTNDLERRSELSYITIIITAMRA